MMTKTTKYKLVKRSISEAASVEQNCPHTNSIQVIYQSSIFFVISNPGLPFFSAILPTAPQCESP